MEIDADTARALGFPKQKYIGIERERRWLCGELPDVAGARSEVITDRYIVGARLRLREARPLDGGPAMRRLTRKVDADPQTRLITSIYLPEAEFALFTGLPARVIRKVRHHLGPIAGVEVSVDRFEGPLAGLILAEAEFESDAAMAAYPDPGFALREVTDDPRYGGGALAADGLPG